MIGKNKRHHCLAHRRRSDTDARIVPTLCQNVRLVALRVDRAARRQDRRGRFDGEARNNGLAGRNAAENAARVVGKENGLSVRAHAHFIGILLARERGAGKAVTDLDALDGVDAHESGGDILVELAVDWSAEPRGDALRNDLDDGSARRPRLPDAVEIGAPALDDRVVRRKERIAIHFLPVPLGAVYLLRSDFVAVADSPIILEVFGMTRMTC